MKFSLGKTLAIIGTSLNAVSLVTTILFFVFSLIVFPKIETKVIIGLFTFVESVTSLSSSIGLAVPYLFSNDFTFSFNSLITLLEPMSSIQPYLYLTYSIHRYAVIAEIESCFKYFQSVTCIFGLFFAAVIMEYGMNEEVQITLCRYNLNDWTGLGCRSLMYSGIALVSNLVARLISFFSLASLQIYIFRTTSVKMEESKKFLSALAWNSGIERRLISVKKINRFNRQITFLFLTALLTKLFCQGLTDILFSYLAIYFVLVIEVIEVLIRPISSLAFVLIHLDKFMQFCAHFRE